MNIRDEIVNAVIREIVGPCPNSNYLDSETGEEILLASVHGSPKSRYGAGMLYPQQAINNGEVDSVGDSTINSIEDEEIPADKEIVKNKRSGYSSGEEKDEEPVGMANQYLPSAMGFTVRFRKEEKNDEIKLEILSAYYEKGKDKKPKKQVDKEGNVVVPTDKEGNTFDSDYWIRRPIKSEPLTVKLNSLFRQAKNSVDTVLKKDSKGKEWLVLRIFNRTTNDDKRENLLTYTFVLINGLNSVTDDATNPDKILYQNELILSTTNENLIAPYKEKYLATDTDEEKELNLLYRKKRVFSIGHGTSVLWNIDSKSDSEYETVKQIKTSVIPVYDLPQVAPTSHVTLSMFELSDLGDWHKAKQSLITLSEMYRAWIEKIETSTSTNEFDDYKEAAKKNVEKCKISLSRINNGIKLLVDAKPDSDLVKCFRWMNRAMIWQQQRSKAKIRKWRKTGVADKQKLYLDYLDVHTKSETFESLQDFHEGKFNGKWRPFQISICINEYIIYN